MRMNHNLLSRILLGLSLVVGLFLVACPTSEENAHVLSMQIDKSNDSLLRFDSLIVTVHSKDGKFSQEVFHGILRDSNQVKGLPLDPRVGREYTITIIGYKDGKVGVNKEVTFLESGSQSKDLPIKRDTPETVVVAPSIPEIQAPTDTAINEDDILHFRVSVRNPWAGSTTLTLKDSISGAVLETAGRDAGDGYFTWRPGFEQGRAEPYAVTFVYSSATQKVEKITRVKVINVNRPPKLSPIENKTGQPESPVTFQVTATDPDGPDGLIVSVDTTTLPQTATFIQGAFNWTPNATQTGNYPIKFRANDGKDSDSLTVILSIGNVNRPPTLSFTADTTIFENDSLTLLISTSDPDGTTPKLFISGNPELPKGCIVTVDKPGPGQGTITWRPGFDQSRKDPYRLVIRAKDETTQVEKTLSISIRNQNRAPKLAEIGNKTVNAGATLSFEIAATDADGDTISFTARELPDGATFLGKSFSWTPSGNQTGNRSVTFRAFDGQDSDLVAVLISVGDIEPPPPLTIEITSPTQDTLINYTPVTVQFTVNGTPRQKTFRLSEGKNRLFVDTTVLGRTAFDTITIELDTTAPERPMVFAESPVNTRTPKWKWIGSGGGSGRFRIRLDSANFSDAIATRDTAFTAATDLSIGTHTLFVQEKDLAGNWSSSGSAAVRIDTTPPNPPLVSSTTGSLTNNAQPSWSWLTGGQGDLGVFQAKLDSPDFTSSDSTTKAKSFVSPLGLKDGAHVLYVRERDSAGNWSKVSASSIKIDRTPPGTPMLFALPKSPLNSLTPTWGWISGGDGIASYRFKLDNADLSGAAETIATRFTASPQLSEGPHTLFVQERDSAGNWSASGSRELTLAIRGPVSNTGFSPANVYDLSLSLNKENVIHVAFRDAMNEEKATVMRLNGLSWQFVGTAGFSSGRVFGTTLQIDNQGSPLVAYLDGDLEFRATVMKYTGSTWAVIGSPGFTPGMAGDLQLGILKDGSPIVTYRDTSAKASAMRFNGTNWVDLGPPGFSPGKVGAVKHTVSPSGTLIVLFEDETQTNRLTAMKFDGTSWVVLGNAGFTPGYISQPVIAADDKDIPYVGFQDFANGNRATVMRLQKSSWEYVGEPGFSDDIAQSNAIAIDKNGIPYFAFGEGVNSNLSVMRWHHLTWEYAGEPGLTTKGASYISMAISSTGVPYVGFSDEAKAKAASVYQISFDPEPN